MTPTLISTGVAIRPPWTEHLPTNLNWYFIRSFEATQADAIVYDLLYAIWKHRIDEAMKGTTRKTKNHRNNNHYRMCAEQKTVVNGRHSASEFEMRNYVKRPFPWLRRFPLWFQAERSFLE